MDRSQIIPRRHTYLAIVCVVFIALALLAAGCTGKEGITPASPSTSGSGSSGAGVQDGDLVEIDYTGTLANGTVFDSSKERGPFQFVVGTGTAISGFDNQIRGMTVGQTKKFTLTPDEAYGEYDPTLIKSMPIGFIPKGENVSVGDTITLFNGEAYFPAKITNLNATNVTFDLNHQLAGQSLTFEVKLVNLTPASEVEAMMNQSENETGMFDENATEEIPLELDENATATEEIPLELDENATATEEIPLGLDENSTTETQAAPITEPVVNQTSNTSAGVKTT